MKKFPKSFVFGVADADLQVMSEAMTLKHEGSEKTMWTHFAEQSGKVHENESPLEGVNRYELWEQDLALISELGVRSYRTSISMSRILKRDGSVNGKAVAWYRNYFLALRERGLSVAATLYHWELPLYLHEIGGWTNRKTCEVFERHAAAVAEELGDLIDCYFILNEPWCASLLSYHLGIHAPGEEKLESALLAAHNLLLAQARAFRVLKSANLEAEISTVLNIEPAYAATASEADLQARELADCYVNRWFLEPIFLGRYPETLLERWAECCPEFSAADLQEIRIGAELDSLGVNNYSGVLARENEQHPTGYGRLIHENGKTNGLGWPIFESPLYPSQLYDLLSELFFTYKEHGLRALYVTENGMALRSDWNGCSQRVNDEARVEYYRIHLKQVHQALERGVPVKGYYAWTLMDNYEWAEGYRADSCFGLVHVDRPSMKRIPKLSYDFYANLCRTAELE